MLVLLLVAFISGLLTIFAPCIWPILPIVLSTSATGGHRRPLGVTTGILVSFSVLTLSLSYLVRIFNFDPDRLRLLAVLVLAFLGLVLLVPRLSAFLEGLASRFSGFFSAKGGSVSSGSRSGFWSGFFTGITLGIVWAPCAGPILATIAALSVTRAVTSQVVLVTLVYMIGTGIPLFLFATFGSALLTKSRALSPYTGRIQQIFGIIMILTSIFIYTGYDRIIQARLLNVFPSYSSFLYKLEQTNQVQSELGRLTGREKNTTFAPKSFLPDLGKAPDFIGINQWLNSEPLSMASLKGKVVLVDFWTYTCINCIRTLPFVTGWYDKYKDHGLVVIGVHTPEFEFEKKTENVQKAIRMFSINYPVAQDNSYSTWNNFNNNYWPAKYLIDKDGRVRYSHFGEGEYKETEIAIQALLAETGSSTPTEILDMPDSGPKTRLTPEIYLGKNRMTALDSKEKPFIGIQRYSLPTTVSEESFALEGEWELSGEYVESSVNSSLELNYYGDKVFLVITPKSNSDDVTVNLDGLPVDDNFAGEDVKDGKIIFDESRLYELINLKGSPGRHLLRLDFGSKGTRIFAFTFG